jgi:hypothetical protein
MDSIFPYLWDSGQMMFSSMDVIRSQELGGSTRAAVATVFSALLIRSSRSSSEYCERCLRANAASFSAVLLALAFRFLGILNSAEN